MELIQKGTGFVRNFASEAGSTAVSIVGTAISTPVKIATDTYGHVTEGAKSIYEDTKSKPQLLVGVLAAAAFFALR